MRLVSTPDKKSTYQTGGNLVIAPDQFAMVMLLGFAEETLTKYAFAG
jgi:hypothetical protein